MSKNLTKYEKPIAKAILNAGYDNQSVLSYFSHPKRSLNPARIAEVKASKIPAATQDELDKFLKNWPPYDLETGLDLKKGHLLIKAREAMLSAIQTYNGAALNFRSELFIVTSNIAWTYLLHAYYKKEDKDYWYKPESNDENRRYWDLSKCLRVGACPLDKVVKSNLEYLIELRDEIVHAGSHEIDPALTPELQASVLNFNDFLKTRFDPHYSLERRMSIALQCVSFDLTQKKALIGADLPAEIQTLRAKYDSQLSEEERADPKFRYRVALVPLKGNNPNTADASMVLLDPSSPEAQNAALAIERSVELPKLRAKKVLRAIHKAGDYSWFNIHTHTTFWKEFDGKNPMKNFGADVGGQWFWYENWVEFTLKKLKKGWRPPPKPDL